jgi:hypothetical protein
MRFLHRSEYHDWLVVSTILKNISQWEVSHILWKIKNVPNQQPNDDYDIRNP